jgi:2-amino-4-hydroxy-6-hydroxymethyldihydropteridine diphosphokinase
MPQQVFIGIGSNLGDRKAHYYEALERVARLSRTRIVKESSLYESEPIGDAETWYVNGAIEIETEFPPEPLLRHLKAIERAMGRTKKAQAKKWTSRTIDLDILFFGNRVVDTRSLKIPHPELHNRRFVLLPLSELAPNLIHPHFGTTISRLLAALKGDKKVILMPP